MSGNFIEIDDPSTVAETGPCVENICLALGNDSLITCAPKAMLHPRRIATSEREIAKTERECRLARSNENLLDGAALQIRRPRNHIRDDCERSHDRLTAPRTFHKLRAPFVHVVHVLAVAQRQAERKYLINHGTRRRSSTYRRSQVFFGRSRWRTHQQTRRYLTDQSIRS